MEFLNSLQSFLQTSCKTPPSSLPTLLEYSQQFRSLIQNQLRTVFENHSPSSNTGALSLKELALLSACTDLVAIWVMDTQLFTSAILPSPVYSSSAHDPTTTSSSSFSSSISSSSSSSILPIIMDKNTIQINEHIQYILYNRCTKLARTLGGMGAASSLLFQGSQIIPSLYFGTTTTNTTEDGTKTFSPSVPMPETTTEFQLMHQILINCYAAFHTLLTHKCCDPRLTDKLVPVLYATALLLDRRNTLFPSLKNTTEENTTIPTIIPLLNNDSNVQSLLSTLPPRISAQAFMWLASGQYIAVMASGSMHNSSSSSTNLPSLSSANSSGPPKLSTPFDPLLLVPSWLRVSAAASLAKLSMQAGGIEGILDAFFSGIDIENELAVDRIRNQINTILSKPPLETCTPHQYFSSLGKQLLPLLRLGGKDAYLITTTVALLIGHLLANQEYSVIVQETILQPLLAPLITIAKAPVLDDKLKKAINPSTASIKPSVRSPLIQVIDESDNGNESSTTLSIPSNASDPVYYTQILVNENDLMGCIEDWHKILTASPLLLLNTQTSKLLIELSPIWLDIYMRTHSSKVLNNFSTAVAEVFANILSGIPTYLGTIIILRILYDIEIVSNEAIIASIISSLHLNGAQTQEIRSIVDSLHYRHSDCGLTMGEYGGLRVSGFTYPVSLDGQSMIMNSESKASEADFELRLPIHNISSRSLSASSAAKASLSNLLNVRNDDDPRLTGETSSMNTLYSEKEHDPKTHSVDLEGQRSKERTLSSTRIENHATRYAKLANAIVDILLEVKPHRSSTSVSTANRTASITGSETIAGFLFTYLLKEYSTYRIQILADTEDSSIAPSTMNNNVFHKEQSIHSLQLLITLTERLGPQLLRSSIQIIQAIRNTLVIIIVALGLPFPEPTTVGCTGVAAEIHTTNIPIGANIIQDTKDAKSIKTIESSTNDDTSELISTCLGLLTVVMTGSSDTGSSSSKNEDVKTSSADEERQIVYWLRSFLPLLASLQYYRDVHLQEMATALRAAILLIPEMSISASSSRSDSKDSSKSSTSSSEKIYDDQTVQDAIALILDPAPALQANGIRIIARIVRTDPPLLRSSAGLTGLYTTILSAKASTIFDLVIRQMETTEPYVYLAAIECLQAFALTYPVAVLPKILRLYVVSDIDNEDVNNQRMDALDKDMASSSERSSSSSTVNLSIRARVKLGEVLSLCTIGAGRSGSLPAYAAPILGALMRIGISGWKRQENITNQLVQAGTFVNLPTSTVIETDQHLPVKDANEVYNLTLRLQDYTDLRSSALACLGEISAYLGYTLAMHIQDILGGLTGVLTMEIQSRALTTINDRKTIDPEVVMVIQQTWIKVRRSAGYALRRLIEGDSLGRGNGHISLFDNPSTIQYVREIHQLVQRIMTTDPDPLVQQHAKDASVAMDIIVKRYVSNTSSANINTPRGIGRIISPGMNYRTVRTSSSFSTDDSYVDRSTSTIPQASISTLKREEQ